MVYDEERNSYVPCLRVHGILWGKVQREIKPRNGNSLREQL